MLVQKSLIVDYVSWCINERNVKGESLKSHLGRLDVAMRQHPSFATLNLSWFKPLLESLPIEPEAERRMRKAQKYLDYSIIEGIPAKIHALRLSTPANCDADRAELATAEFLIRCLLTLLWRQRNLRECRISGSRPNIFKAKIPTHIPIDLPAWVRAEEQRNPEATFWQMHFNPKETKTGREIHAFVPRQLITPLEEYLREFRPLLLKNGDPGALFVTKNGAPMKPGQVYNLITGITWRHGGRSVNPHLFRDIAAFAWLKEHPKDYLTLSKILWHSNINYTIKVYGSRFDESSGVCAMETWLEEREARSK